MDASAKNVLNLVAEVPYMMKQIIANQKGPPLVVATAINLRNIACLVLGGTCSAFKLSEIRLRCGPCRARVLPVFRGKVTV